MELASGGNYSSLGLAIEVEAVWGSPGQFMQRRGEWVHLKPQRRNCKGMLWRSEGGYSVPMLGAPFCRGLYGVQIFGT